jgi:hypothetical protein
MTRLPRLPAPATRLLVTLVCLLLPVAVLSAWVAAFVTDTDRYVATVAPLAEDPVVLEATERRLETLALEQIDFDRLRAELATFLAERRTGPVLTKGAFALADVAETSVRTLVHRAVAKVVRSKEFASAWEAANRSAHEYMVAVLSGSAESPGEAAGRVSVRVGTLLNQVLAVLHDKGLLDKVEAPQVDTTFRLLRTADLERARTAYRLLDWLGFWLPVLWLASAVALVVFAPDRRRALAWLGFGTAGTVLVLGVALLVVRGLLASSATSAQQAAVVRELWDFLVVDLRTTLRVLLAAAAAGLLALWVSGPSTRAMRLRHTTRRTSALVADRVDADLVRVTAVGAVVLVALFWVV